MHISIFQSTAKYSHGSYGQEKWENVKVQECKS